MNPPGLGEIVRGLIGALRLARFDAGGAALIDPTPGGAARSFWVAVYLLPLHALAIATLADQDFTGLPLAYVLLVEALTYVISWTAFPAIMELVVRPMDRRAEYFAMVAALNWSAVVRTAIRIPQMVLVGCDLVSEQTAGAMGAVILAIILVYLGFIFKTTLRIDGFTAASLVVMKILVSALVGDFADQLLDWGVDAGG